MESKLKKYMGLFIIAVIGLASDFFFTQKLCVEYQVDSITIRSGLLYERIELKGVSRAEWIEQSVIGARVSGYQTFQYEVGEFLGAVQGERIKVFQDRGYMGRFLKIVSNDRIIVVGSNNIDMIRLYSFFMQ